MGLFGKGSEAEEALRQYFADNEYLAVRNVPFAYRGFEVTDVDIWLYGRPSSVSRERVIVDAKNKKTPQAIERIFWTVGLKTALNVETGIVATTDNRPAVAEFGRRSGILVLNGDFLRKLTARGSAPDRLTEEELLGLIRRFELAKYSGDWIARLKAAKARLLSELDYDAINAWLEEGRFFAEQTLLIPLHKEVACRVLYMMLCLIGVGADFRLKEVAFQDETRKKEAINNGLRFGSRGVEGMSNIVETATALVEKFVPEGTGAAVRIRRGIAEDLDGLETQVLADFFARKDVGKELFAVVRQFEAAAHRRVFLPPDDLSAGAKSVLGVALDFWHIDRVKFLGLF